MTLSLAEIEPGIEAVTPAGGAQSMADILLQMGEDVLANWIEAKGLTATVETREGFRLLALHRQGAKGDPSFNACRETTRELAYRYNVATGVFAEGNIDQSLEMMRHLARHLYLFVSGKMQEQGLGEFCCSSKPLRLNSNNTD